MDSWTGEVDGRADRHSWMQCNATIGRPHASAKRSARVDLRRTVLSGGGREVQVSADEGVRFAVRRAEQLAGRVGRDESALASQSRRRSWKLGRRQGCRRDGSHAAHPIDVIFGTRRAGDVPVFTIQYSLPVVAVGQLVVPVHYALVSASMCRTLDPDDCLHCICIALLAVVERVGIRITCFGKPGVREESVVD